MSKKEECQKSTQNPACPFIKEIRQHGEDLAQIKTLLVGDLENKKPGLMEEIRDIRQSLKRRVTPRDLGALLVGIAALVTAIIAILR